MGYINLDKLVDCEVEFGGKKYLLKLFTTAEMLAFQDKTNSLNLADEKDNQTYTDLIYGVVFGAFQKQGHNVAVSFDAFKDLIHPKQARCLYMILAGRGFLLNEDGELKEELLKNVLMSQKK